MQKYYLFYHYPPPQLSQSKMWREEEYFTELRKVGRNILRNPVTVSLMLLIHFSTGNSLKWAWKDIIHMENIVCWLMRTAFCLLCSFIFFGQFNFKEYNIEFLMVMHKKIMFKKNCVYFLLIFFLISKITWIIQDIHRYRRCRYPNLPRKF